MVADNRYQREDDTAPPNSRLSSVATFSLASLFLSITLFAVCLGLYQLSDFVGVVLGCFLVPAWLIAVVQIGRKSRRNALSVSARLDEYFQAVRIMADVALMLILVAAAICALMSVMGHVL
jgi:hypothetical protein